MDNKIELGSEIDVFGENLYLGRLRQHFKVCNVFTSQSSSNLHKATNHRPLVVVSSGRISTALAAASVFSDSVIHVTTLMQDWPQQLGDLQFNENAKEIYSSHSREIGEISKIFSDEKSEEIFDKIINFRKTYDLEYIRNFEDNQRHQYFEPFLPDSLDGSFIDVGAFDGWTSKCFRSIYGESNRIIMLEPDPLNREIYFDQISAIPNSELLAKGAGERFKKERFSSAGSASGISRAGQHEVEIVPLDSVTNKKVGMIKMDIEGAEMSALRGAENILYKFLPILAIACYHSPLQLLEIPSYISRLNGDYKVFLRHYTESIYETVAYGVPR